MESFVCGLLTTLGTLPFFKCLAPESLQIGEVLKVTNTLFFLSQLCSLCLHAAGRPLREDGCKQVNHLFQDWWTKPILERGHTVPCGGNMGGLPAFVELEAQGGFLGTHLENECDLARVSRKRKWHWQKHGRKRGGMSPRWIWDTWRELRLQTYQAPRQSSHRRKCGHCQKSCCAEPGPGLTRK